MKLSNGESKGKVAVITGGSSGIGHALCEMLVGFGLKVFSLDIAAPKDPIPRVHYLSADVSDAVSLDSAFANMREASGKIDMFINNAGVIRRGNIFDISEDDFNLMFRVNVKGYWLALKKTMPLMEKGATVVFMSSRHGLYLPADPGIYAVTKQADVGIAESFAKGYPRFTVKIACPGSTDTPLGSFQIDPDALVEKKKRMLSPKELAAKIIALVESDNRWLVFDEKTEEYLMR